MNKSDIGEMLKKLPSEERDKLYHKAKEVGFEHLSQMSEQELLTWLKTVPLIPERASSKTAVETKNDSQQGNWFDKPLCGLTKEGIKHLKELTEQLENPSTSHHVDRKLVRYLKQLKNMRMVVPDIFRTKESPKALYRRLVSFCKDHDIPEEIVQRVVPALYTYIETGYLRPILFVGEKGSGKTTAVKLLVEEALKLHTEVIKIPQMDGGHGMTGDSGTYQSADAGRIAKARLRTNSLLVAYLFDEIDKVSHERNRANVDDELLSITDESCCDIYDNFLETTLVGLEHCPMFMTANDLQKVSPILADRCNIVYFPNATSSRIKSISKKYVEKKMKGDIYSLIRFDYEMMNLHIDNLVNHGVTSIRKHQQMIEAVLENALDVALSQESEDIVSVTKEMFAVAERTVLSTEKRRAGFGR